MESREDKKSLFIAGLLFASWFKRLSVYIPNKSSQSPHEVGPSSPFYRMFMGNRGLEG